MNKITSLINNIQFHINIINTHEQQSLACWTNQRTEPHSRETILLQEHSHRHQEQHLNLRKLCTSSQGIHLVVSWNRTGKFGQLIVSKTSVKHRIQYLRSSLLRLASHCWALFRTFIDQRTKELRDQREHRNRRTGDDSERSLTLVLRWWRWHWCHKGNVKQSHTGQQRRNSKKISTDSQESQKRKFPRLSL